MEAIQFNFIAIMLGKEGKDTKMGFKNAKEWDRGNVVQCTKGKSAKRRKRKDQFPSPSDQYGFQFPAAARRGRRIDQEVFWPFSVLSVSFL